MATATPCGMLYLIFAVAAVVMPAILLTAAEDQSESVKDAELKRLGAGARDTAERITPLNKNIQEQRLLLKEKDDRVGRVVSGKNQRTTAPSAVRQVGQCRVKGLVEASGIVASARQADVYWTHNDGDDGVLYAVRADGSFVGRIAVDAKFQDWEDIAADDNGNLYLANTGNNDRNRKRVTIYRIPESEPAANGNVEPAETWKLGFPDKPFDCEAVFIWKDHGYVISKHDSGVPAAVYRFALTPGKKPRTLEKVVELAIDQPVTAADITRDGRLLAVLTSDSLHVMQIDGDITRAKDTTSRKFRIPSVQAEGCCFTPTGVMVIAETGEMYLVEHETRAPTQPAAKD